MPYLIFWLFGRASQRLFWNRSIHIGVLSLELWDSVQIISFPTINRIASNRMEKAPQETGEKDGHQKSQGIDFYSQNLHCQKHDEQIVMICTDSACKLRGLVCPMCAHEEHFPHSNMVKPLKLLAKMFSQDHADSQSHIEYAAYVDIKENLFKEILATEIIDEKARQIVRVSMQKYFDNLKKVLQGEWFHRLDRARQRASRRQPVNSSGSEKQNQAYQKASAAEIEKILLEYLDWTNFEKPAHKSNFVAKMALVRQDLEDKHTMLREAIKKKQMDESLAEMFLSEGAGKKFRFSNTLKHNNMHVENGTKVTVKDQYDTVMCLVEPELKGKRTIKIKSISLPSWTSFGICFRSIVKSNNYSFPSQEHGTFQVSYDGYSWTHKTPLNENYHGWYFNEGDTVTIEYDPKALTLTFTRNEEENAKHVMNFVPIKGEKVHFCVGLNSHDEAAQIIDM